MGSRLQKCFFADRILGKIAAELAISCCFVVCITMLQVLTVALSNLIGL